MRTPRLMPAVALCLAALIGCTTTAPTPTSSARPLVVGVSSTSPPYAVRRGTELTGLDVDFARALAAQLGRPLTLIDLPFAEQMAALGTGRIDIIMAGMSITRGRGLRLAFSEPYLVSGLVGVMRRGDAGRYKTAADIMKSSGTIGVIEGTTSDQFVREQMQASQVSVYPTVAAAIDELRGNRLDLVVTDAPVAAWYVSANEGELAALPIRLNEERLAWGMRRDDQALLTAVNGALAGWQTDGTRDRILDRWVPFWRRLAER